MAPSAIDSTPVSSKAANGGAAPHVQPLGLAGVLDAHEHVDLTPAIGREFPKARLVDWLKAPNSDELLRDLAITSQQPSTPFNKPLSLSMCLPPVCVYKCTYLCVKLTASGRSLAARRRLLPRPGRPDQ